MSRRIVIFTVVIGLLSGACGRLGVGLPGCQTATFDPTPATVLVLQAVPTADYAPCLNSLKLGWDEVEFQVERGRATIEIGREFSPFLEVQLTESCDIGDATSVPSGNPEVARYENVVSIGGDIRITIIPTAERPRIYALQLAEELRGIEIEDRSVVFSVDEDVDFLVSSRVNKALFTDDYVWIIDDLDREEETLELRRTADGEGARGLSVDDALDLIEEQTPEERYEGQWYLVFNGGCVTYDFDAEGTVAETIAADTEEAIGLYPNAELREAGRRAGYELLDE